MAVNAQITDAVTQANRKVADDAMGNLYQATAQALSNAAHNAVSAQQQSMIIAQAATTQGVAALYSLDAAASGQALPPTLEHATSEVAIPAVSLPAPHHLAGADDFAYGVRAVGDALAASLDALGRTTCENLLRVLQLAATSACLTAMVANPEKAASYEEVLAAIQRVAR